MRKQSPPPESRSTDFDAEELAEAVGGGTEPEVECVDSMLQFSADKSELLDDEDDTPTELLDSAPLPTPLRQLALELLQILQGSAQQDATAQLAVLRSIVDRLKSLYQALIAARLRYPAVHALGEILQRLHALLGGSRPRKSAIVRVWARIDKCLQRLRVSGENPQSPPREGFWK